MSAHVILRGADLVLSAERAEAAPEAVCGASCLTCQAGSGLVDNDPKQVRVWALEHTRHSGMTHGQFVVRTERHWRVDRVHSLPGAEPQPGGYMSAVVTPAAKDAQRPRRPGAHARPRGRRLGRGTAFRPLRPLVARAGRAVGPLLLSGFVLVSVLFAVLSQRGGGA